MNIDWKSRVKNGCFWLGIISTAATAIFYILQLCGVELPVSSEQVTEAATLVLSVFAAIGVITNPTTPGITDPEEEKDENETEV